MPLRNPFLRGRKRPLHSLSQSTNSISETRDEKSASNDLNRETRHIALSKINVAQDNSRTARVPANNLPRRSTIFGGRGEILERIHDALTPRLTGKAPGSVFLTGMGGIGKSQVALEYCYRHLASYDVVLWVHAETKVSIFHSVKEAAHALGFPDEDYAANSSQFAMEQVLHQASM